MAPRLAMSKFPLSGPSMTVADQLAAMLPDMIKCVYSVVKDGYVFSYYAIFFPFR